VARNYVFNHKNISSILKRSAVRIHDYSRTSDRAAESLKDAATDIRESSSTTKQLVHTLVRTGAIEEIARAILETTIAIRDIANEVNETVKDLKERGTIKGTASAVVETTNTTRNTIEIAKAAIETDNNKLQLQTKSKRIHRENR
jgi:ParB-like chromosome segregation protein Spo0J